MQGRATPSGWYADPQGRFEYRYFNGVQWTSDVAINGQRYVDSFVDRPVPPQLQPPRPRGMAITSFVTGLAGVYVGPSDLTLALGGERSVDESIRTQFEAALFRIRDAARQAGVAAGIHTTNGEDAHRRLAEGFTFATVSSDLVHLEAAARTHLDATRAS